MNRVLSSFLRRRYFSSELQAVYQPHAFPVFDIITVGSGASIPQRYRGLPSTVLSLGGENWMFDIGEGTSRQLQSVFNKSLSVSSTTRIFITHMHLDHILGLASVVASSLATENAPLEIYGPPGLHRFLCEIFYSSATKFANSVIVYEFDVTTADINWLFPKSSDYKKMEDRKGKKVLTPRLWRHPFFNNELLCESNRLSEAQICYSNIKRKSIRSTSPGVWLCKEDVKSVVTACFIEHTAPCFGFIVKERDIAGHFMIDKVNQIVRDCNLPPLTRELKQLKLGFDVTLGNNDIIRCKEVTGEPTAGRKVVILGDTCSARLMAEHARDCDVLVHEATIFNEDKYSASSRGHSTPAMAAACAKLFNAKRLVLSHISSRFKINASSKGGTAGAESNEVVTDSDLAAEASKVLGRAGHVKIARDYSVFSVPLGGYKLDSDDFLMKMPHRQ